MKRLSSAHRLLPLLAVAVATACGGSNGAPTAPTPAIPSLERLDELVDAQTRSGIEGATRALEKAPQSASAWAHLGRTYEAAKFEMRAETCYRAALTLAPNEPRHAYRAAITAHRQGAVDRALDHIAQVAEAAPDYGPAWRRTALWRLERGEIDGARKALERASALLPGTPDADVVRTRIELLDDNVDAALAAARKAHGLAPDDRYIRLLLGEALRRSGQPDEAAPHLKAGRDSSPSFVDPWSEDVARARDRDNALTEEGRELEKKGEFAAAIARYDQVLARRPDDSFLLHHKGICLLAAKRGADALEHLEAAHALLPGDFDISVARVGALRAVGRTDDARVAAQMILADWPERGASHVILGQLLADAGDTSAALASFGEAMRLEPGNVRPRLFQAQLLLGQDRPDGALATLRGIEAEDSALPLPYFRLLLVALVRSGQPRSEVQDTYDRAVRVHGDAANALLKKR